MSELKNNRLKVKKINAKTLLELIRILNTPATDIKVLIACCKSHSNYYKIKDSNFNIM